MTNAVTQTVHDLWTQGRKTKSSGSGWISGNAVCCSDKRGRGGLRPDVDGWVWHCFNCQFKTGWVKGKLLSDKNKRLLKLLGANDDQISQLTMTALRLKEDIPLLQPKALTQSFPPHDLPDNAIPLIDALSLYPDNVNLLEICDTILQRNLEVERYLWADDMPNRWIIPYTWKGINVGWTARSIGNARPKYLSHTPSGYVYGMDHQHEDWKLMIVCEGVLDADSIGGVAILGNNISPQQREHIESAGKDIIWVADQDETGLKLTENILEWGWAVSIPHWPNCKDINDAVVQYGRAATLLSIITSATRSRVTTTLRIKQLRHKLKHERTS